MRFDDVAVVVGFLIFDIFISGLHGLGLLGLLLLVCSHVHIPIYSPSASPGHAESSIGFESSLKDCCEYFSRARIYKPTLHPGYFRIC